MKPSLLLVAAAGLFATGAPAHDPGVWQIVDALVKQRFQVQPRSG